MVVVVVVGTDADADERKRLVGVTTRANRGYPRESGRVTDNPVEGKRLNHGQDVMFRSNRNGGQD